MKFRHLFFLPLALAIMLLALFELFPAIKLTLDASLRGGHAAHSKVGSESDNRQDNGHDLSPKQVAEVQKLKQAYSAPITFYGKVVDDNGVPVPSAGVHYSIENKYFGDGLKREGISDPKGDFDISGVSGAGIYVSVWKAGYDGTEKSHASFGYGIHSGQRPPTRDSPAIFVLRKKKPADSLIKVASRQFELSKSGEAVGVDLGSGKTVPSEKANIVVESWVKDDEKDARRRFDWSCRVTVPGGGLVLRKKSEVEAPEGGFSTSDSFGATKSDLHWSDRVEREYFLKLSDQTYARLTLQMMAGGHFNFFVLESYLNPSGSRNLEYDPAKRVKGR